MLNKKAPSGSHLVVWAAVVLLGAVCVAAQAAPFECFAVSDLVRVFEDGYGLPQRSKAIEIFGIRNEWLSAQCVIKADQDFEHVTVSLSPLVHVNGGASLPTEAVTWNFVGSIRIEQNTPKHRQSDLIRQAPAWFPDYLADDREISLKKGKYKAVYLTVRVPRDAEAGDYNGTVTIRTERGDESLPLHLTVYPLTLPDKRHLMVTEWYTTSNFKKFHGIDTSDSESFYKMLGVYARNMAEHRQNVFRVSLGLIAGELDDKGKLKFDFTKFDKWADVFWNTGRMDLLETGFIARFRDGGWSSEEIVLRDFRVREQSSGRSITMPGKEYLAQFLPAFEAHLKEKGWLRKTVFHIADEPSNHNVMTYREACDYVHRYAPDLRRIDAIETTHCLNRLEIWVPKLDHLATWYDAYQKAQRQGYELWFYTVGIFQGGSYPNKTVDVPLIESRLLHWLNYRYGLKGYLHWGFNAWTDDPFNAPGKHRGDGWHVYPKKDGLLNSLRWEQMRNGLQDYEYFWMLEDKISKIKAGLSNRLSMIDPARRGVEIASGVVKTMGDYSKNPHTLYAAKKQIIEELLDLDRAPRVLVQTNPLEHTVVEHGCSIDLYGWAEPGTKITVQGTELPVAEDGLFMENVSLSRDNTIVIQAEHKKGKKMIIRSFEALN
jgi:Glycoside hydrolase 123, catalytic domain/Glycoside hydrolase 123 N-terminal domain